MALKYVPFVLDGSRCLGCLNVLFHLNPYYPQYIIFRMHRLVFNQHILKDIIYSNSEFL